MGKTGVKGSEGKTGDTLETVKGRGKTGDGGVKGLGKTGDVGVKGSKGKTNGKTGDKGKTGDLEHIPSASGGDFLLDGNTGKINKLKNIPMGDGQVMSMMLLLGEYPYINQSVCSTVC
jgi:hypothetical protein